MIEKHWSHLTQEKRCQILGLLQAGQSNRQIAKKVGVSHTTINRELSDNRKKYNPEKAHKKSQRRKTKARKKLLKLTKKMIDYISLRIIRDKWSPEQIAGRLEREFGSLQISHQTIYRHIKKDSLKGGVLHKSLRRKGRKYTKQLSKQAGRSWIPDRQDISLRPAIVDQKVRIGDFEVDTIVGKNHSGFLVSMVERKTKLTRLALIRYKTAEATSDAIINKLKIFKKGLLHTITTDNGSEFASHKRIAKALGVGFYFATPYRSCERGLNENTNGLIRQYFPKKTDFAKLSSREVRDVEHKLNSRPRKLLGYQTPLEVLFSASSQT